MTQLEADYANFCEAWRRIRVNGRLDASLEGITRIFRYASHGLLVMQAYEDAPDPRQLSLDLQGGKWFPRVVTITAG